MPSPKRFFFILLSICVVNFSVTVYLTYQFVQQSRKTRATSFQIAHENAAQIGQKIDNELLRFKTLVDRLAQDLTNDTLEENQVLERLQTDIENFPDIFGYGLAYARGTYQGKNLYAPYYKKTQTGNFELVQVENLYDYTDPELPAAAWYRETLNSPDGFLWKGPYLGQATQDWFIDYMVPFYRDQQRTEIGGIVYADHTVDTLTDLLTSINVGEEGFSYILSSQGEYIAHSSLEYIQESVFAKADELESKELREIGERAVRGETFSVASVDPITGHPTWIFHRPILNTGWSLGVVFDQQIGQSRPHAFVRPLIWVLLSVMSFLIVLLALIFRLDGGTAFGLWGTSIIASLLLTAGIILLWHLTIRYPHRDPSQNVLVNPATVDDHLARVDLAFDKRKLPPPVRVPTGVALETIDFSTTSQSMISGYIWQKYPLHLSDDIERGFLLADVVDEHEIEEIHRVQEKGHELIVWFFRTPIRQRPTVEKFPLDEGHIRLQIWPRTLSPQIVLAPDLGGYDFILPSQKPGLVDTLVLPNWVVKRTYFSYRYDHYNANFGSRNLIRERDLPDLYFNVVVKRSILSPVIAYTVPMIVIAALMFAILMIKAESSFSELGYSASLFFVLAVSQVGLRSYLQVPRVVYLEYGYILLYITILVVSINSILYNSNLQIPAIQHRNNLWPKLLYWPMLLAAFLGISLILLMPPSVHQS